MPIEPRMGWERIASRFNVLSGTDLLAMSRMPRHQAVRAHVRWLAPDQHPLALLFVSHRWKTLRHPDPDGSDLEAIQEFVRRVGACVEAMLVERRARVDLVPSLAEEGYLQAAELARRVFGFGPFSLDAESPGEPAARERVLRRFEDCSSQGLQPWIFDNLGVWLDYTCMPQRPLADEDRDEFRSSLASLDSLARSSTLVAFRRAGDGYSGRGWCATEFFLNSQRSFARALFVDPDRMRCHEDVAIAPMRDDLGQAGGDVASVAEQAYEQDIRYFRDACQAWRAYAGSFAHHVAPAAWQAYRDLQGSTFFGADTDPNPARRAVEAIRDLERRLVGTWLLSEEPMSLDLAKEMGELLERSELRCSEPEDAIYLGLLLPCHGWIEAFRPLMRDCLRRYLAAVSAVESGGAPAPVRVRLMPPHSGLRSLLWEVDPVSPATWHSRLSTGPGPDPGETRVVEKVEEVLRMRPLRYEFEDGSTRGR